MGLFDLMRGPSMIESEKQNREIMDEALAVLRMGLAEYTSQKMKQNFEKSEIVNYIKDVLRVDLHLDPECPFDTMDEDRLLKFLSRSRWQKTGFFCELDTYGRGFAKSLIVQLRYFRGLWAHRQPISDDDVDYFLGCARRPLELIGSPEANQIELLRRG